MTALTKVEKFEVGQVFDERQIELLKTTICKGSSNDELMFFINVCKKTGLDPFSRQIYSIPRGGQRTIQTSVDGFRLIAERTGRYTPGREPTYTYDKDNNLLSATSYIKKQTKDGTWHEVSASAYLAEYDGKNNFWKKMPHLMLAKCAECLALRKAFPAEMGGIYSEDEMHQADVSSSNVKQLYIKTITTNQALELAHIFAHCSEIVQKNFMEYIKTKFKIELIDDLPENEYEKTRNMLSSRRDEYQVEKSKNDHKVNEDTGEVEE